MLGYSRQNYYYHWRQKEIKAYEEELILQRVIQLRKSQPFLGGRKLFHLVEPFLSEHHLKIGRDAFFDLLRKHQLLVRRRQRNKKTTTVSARGGVDYPNLLLDFEPIRPNQVWVADITYIVIGGGFGYLSLLTDAYSRKIVGYYLSTTLAAEGSVKALQMAIEANGNVYGIIHHSDRGIQYTSQKYLEVLASIQAKISTSQNSDPLENAIAERVNGILKMELLYQHFPTFEQAGKAITYAVEVYNSLRPHTSIDYLTPNQAHQREGELKRKWKNYYKPKPT